MNKELKTFQEFRNEISIIELAVANGYHIVRNAGLKYPVLKNNTTGDKIIIVNAQSTSNQGYFNPRDDKDKGTLINFVHYRLGTLFPMMSGQTDAKSINAILYDYLRLPISKRNRLLEKTTSIIKHYQERKFILPGWITPLNDTSYLQSRRINDKTIFDEIFNGRIFNASVGGFCNIGFPYYDKNDHIIGCELRNTDFKKMLSGSDRSNSVWHSNLPENLESVILTESPIDALSYHQLKGKKDSMYVSFGGSVSDKQLDLLMRFFLQSKRIQISNIILLWIMTQWAVFIQRNLGILFIS